jgi:hypothetical protein
LAVAVRGGGGGSARKKSPFREFDGFGARKPASEAKKDIDRIVFRVLKTKAAFLSCRQI